MDLEELVTFIIGLSFAVFILAVTLCTVAFTLKSLGVF